MSGLITPTISEEETEAIEEALSVPVNTVRIHIQDALKKLSDRKNPDYRNSIKESISAVEGLCKAIAGTPKKSLNSAMDRLGKAGVVIHPAQRKAFKELYGYTSDTDGIRHALMDEPTVGFEDAKYMLVACSAFANYLMAKCAKASIEWT